MSRCPIYETDLDTNNGTIFVKIFECDNATNVLGKLLVYFQGSLLYSS